MKIITRKEAIERGLKRYFTGKPCKRGHLSERRVSGFSCIECADQTSLAFRISNPDYMAAHNKEYRKVNRDRLAQYRRDNLEMSNIRQRRYASGPRGKAIQFMRKCLYRCLARKVDITENLLGYTRCDLVAHIGRCFEKGMSWDNYGDWHIDHIISVSTMIDSGETDPSVVNALTNLRPMWAKENISKGARRDTLL